MSLAIKKITPVSNYYKKNITSLSTVTLPDTYFIYTVSCPGSFTVTLYTSTVTSADTVLWTNANAYLNFSPRAQIFTISGYANGCPLSPFTASWSSNFANTTNYVGPNILYSSSVPVNVNGTDIRINSSINLNTNTSVSYTASMSDYCSSYTSGGGCNSYTNNSTVNIVLNNYPQTLITNGTLSWATSIYQETDGKHVTFKINGAYQKTNVYNFSPASYSTLYTIEYSMFVGNTPNNGNYNTPGNYKISGSGSFTTPSLVWQSIGGSIPATADYIS